MAELTRHEFLLKKDAQYRAGYVAEVVIRMAKLVEVLAAREGLTIDATGNVEGLSEEESKMLSAFVPAVNVNSVREARPVHGPAIEQEVNPLDPYAAKADPFAYVASEKVTDDPKQGQFLADRYMGLVDPLADADPMPEGQDQIIAEGGFFPEDPAIAPAPAVAHALSTGAVVEEGTSEETSETDGDEPTGDADGEGDTEDARTVDDLKAELKDRGLPTGGNKAELVARLAKDDADQAS